MPDVIRFFRGSILLGTAQVDRISTVVELAEDAGIEIPTNCTSGTCGTCMVRLIEGIIPLDDPLPAGLDEYLIEEGARLTCIGIPEGNVSIDLTAPL
ncbi:MAG: 2Fe-2S iron-sulfur cluster-binding protein [Candidatus Poseidoniales archaeon]